MTHAVELVVPEDADVEAATYEELLRHRADHDRPSGNAKLNDRAERPDP